MGITSYFKSSQQNDPYKYVNEKGILTYTIPVTEKKPGETAIYRNPGRPDSLIETIVENNQTINTLQDLFQYSCQKYANEKYLATLVQLQFDLQLFKVNENYEFKTYGQIYEASRQLASAIFHLNLFKEDQVENLKMNAIYSKNREEWLILEFACASYGMQTVPLYDTLGKEGIQFILKQTECKTIFCSLECLLQLAKFKEKQQLETIVCFDKLSPGTEDFTIIQNYLKESNMKLIDYQELLQIGKQYPKEYPKVDPNDVYCLSYTSGTTGNPKGAMITHKNQVAVVAHIFQSDLCQFFMKGKQMSFMPLAHMFEKMLNWNYLFGGSQVFYYRGDVRFLKDDIVLAKPTFLAGVPRVFTRIYDKMKEKIDELKGIKGFIARRALQAKLNAFNSSGAISNKLLDYFIFSQFREAFGGQIKALGSASAPMGDDIEKFLKVTCSVPIYLAYGMTENCASGIVTKCQDISFGHLGGPSMNSELKLISIPELNYSADCFPPKGEVLIRGPSVFKKYYKADEQTKAVIDSEGWLHTGDVAEMIFDDKVFGAIKIIDRVKNIFKLQQGEYIAAEKLESVYGRAQGVQEIVIYGDSMQTYIIAIVVPLREIIEKYAQVKKIQGNYEELCKNPQINSWILENLVKEAKQNDLNSLEIIKKIYVEPLSFGNQDLLTPSFKIKRFLLKEKYSNVIKSLYEQK